MIIGKNANRYNPILQVKLSISENYNGLRGAGHQADGISNRVMIKQRQAINNLKNI